MASLKKYLYYKKSKNIQSLNKMPEIHLYKVADYDATFAYLMSALKLVGLRVTRNDSTFGRFCWNVFYWFQFTNLAVAGVLQVANMVYTKKGSFQDATDIFMMMPCVSYVVLAIAKTYKIVCYRPIYENLISELRSMWPQGTVSGEDHDIISSAMTQLDYVVKGYFWCNHALIVIFVAPTLMQILKRALGHDAPLFLPFMYWLPFDPFHSYYAMVLTLEVWQGLMTVWFMLCGDLFFCILMSHIIAQFNLLTVRIKKFIYTPIDRQLIETFPLGIYTKEHHQKDDQNQISSTNTQWNDTKAMVKYSMNDTYQLELADIVLRHQALIRLSGDVECMFSFALLLNFFFSSIIICLCGFCCVVVEKWNEFIYKTFLLTSLAQTWLLCLYGDRLVHSSAGVADAIYSCGWYQASSKVNRSLRIMLLRSQKVVFVTTYGFSIISLSSFTKIINTSWSYFTLLLNFYKR